MSINIHPGGRRCVQVDIEIPGTPEAAWNAIANVTQWHPPHRFAAEIADLGPDAPVITTEWIAEARDDEKCAVRVVHSILASGDDWDSQLCAWKSGWPWFFRILRLYVARFPGRPGAAFRIMGASPVSAAEAWPTFEAPLGLRNGTADVPALAG